MPTVEPKANATTTTETESRLDFRCNRQQPPREANKTVVILLSVGRARDSRPGCGTRRNTGRDPVEVAGLCVGAFSTWNVAQGKMLARASGIAAGLRPEHFGTLFIAIALFGCLCRLFDFLRIILALVYREELVTVQCPSSTQLRRLCFYTICIVTRAERLWAIIKYHSPFNIKIEIFFKCFFFFYIHTNICILINIVIIGYFKHDTQISMN